MSMLSDHWKDLVHQKYPPLYNNGRWRFYEAEEEDDAISIHPDLMFNFWHELIWFGSEKSPSKK